MSFVASILLVATALPQHDWSKADERIECGPLVLDVFVSRTAHVFHVVDQLAQWSQYCHGQYRSAMTLSDDDELALRSYAKVRRERGWGRGLEQTFYVPLDLDAAIRAGLRDGHVTDEEANVIRPVLERFAPRVDPLMTSKRTHLDRAFATVDRERLTRAAEELSRFVGVKQLVVPVFPIASPTAGGGAMDGGRLRWEIASESVDVSVLVHELTHAFVMQRNELLEATVARTPGLSMTLLGEGIAYAMAPGIHSNGDRDDLRDVVARDRAGDVAWKDDGPGRFRMYALGLRPSFKEALATSTLEAFLPRARDVFLALREVEEARATSAGPPRLGIAGPAALVVRERLLSGKFKNWISVTNHGAANYDSLLPKLGANGLFVMLVAGDDRERIPAAHAALSPVALDEIERRLKKGESIAESKVAGNLRVVLLAAPTKSALEALARTSPLLDE